MARRALVGLMFALLCGACADPGEACAAEGGQCKIAPTCYGKGLLGNTDCNPSKNPGGAVCCLPCPVSRTQPDGGCV